MSGLRVAVKIENTYEDGHTSERAVTVKAPPEGGSLSAWWESVVFPHTGDGHGIDSDLGSCYTATIIIADDPNLVGETNEWID